MLASHCSATTDSGSVSPNPASSQASCQRVECRVELAQREGVAGVLRREERILELAQAGAPLGDGRGLAQHAPSLVETLEQGGQAAPAPRPRAPRFRRRARSFPTRRRPARRRSPAASGAGRRARCSAPCPHSSGRSSALRCSPCRPQRMPASRIQRCSSGRSSSPMPKRLRSAGTCSRSSTSLAATRDCGRSSSSSSACTRGSNCRRARSARLNGMKRGSSRSGRPNTASMCGA